MPITTRTAAALIKNAQPEHATEETPDFLQEAVNLSIEIKAAQREIARLKTFLHQHDLLSQFEIWQTTEQANQESNEE